MRFCRRCTGVIRVSIPPLREFCADCCNRTRLDAWPRERLAGEDGRVLYTQRLLRLVVRYLVREFPC